MIESYKKGIKNAEIKQGRNKKIIPHRDPMLLVDEVISSEREDKGIATCSAEVYNHGELVATGDVTLAMR